MSQITQYLNPEINEAIEKLYVNTNINSKDQKEKGIQELQKTFIQRLSKSLEQQNKLEVTDLILDKSVRISEVIENYDWPTTESLKVPNLYRNTNLLYLYVKARLNMLSGKGKKMAKEGPVKAVENLIKILSEIIEDKLTLDNNLIYICFEDLLSFYCLSNFDEKCNNSIKEFITFYQEETNIKGLIKMDKIDKNAETNFFRGTLITLFQFKIDLLKQNKDINMSDMENIFKHEKVLRNTCFLLDVNFVWTYACYKYINENNKDAELQLCQTCMELFRISKDYKQFLIPTKTSMISFVSKHIEKLRSLIIIYLLNNSIRLNDTFFLVLDYDQRQIEELRALSCQNLFPLTKIIDYNRIKDYRLMKFDQAIVKKMKEDKKEKASNELREKYNELFLKKGKVFNEKDIKDNGDYLKRLTEENKRFKDLL